MGSGAEAAVFGLRLALTLANARKPSSTSTASDTTARIRPTPAHLSGMGPAAARGILPLLSVVTRAGGFGLKPFRVPCDRFFACAPTS